MPETHIRPLFTDLKREENSPALQKLVNYIKTTWIYLSAFPPKNWSVFNLSFRTNNDVEGWHHRINKKAKIKTPFYLLIKLLYAEANKISTNIELLSLKKFKRRLRKKYALLNRRIFKLCQEYIAGKRSAKKLLKSCSYLIASYEQIKLFQKR